MATQPQKRNDAHDVLMALAGAVILIPGLALLGISTFLLFSVNWQDGWAFLHVIYILIFTLPGAGLSLLGGLLMRVASRNARRQGQSFRRRRGQKCPHCGYDLRAHQHGVNCPERGMTQR